MDRNEYILNRFMQNSTTTLEVTFNNKIYYIEVCGNVDKCTGFIYYTFEFDENNKIVISKFGGEEWKIANIISDDKIASVLGCILDNSMH